MNEMQKIASQYADLAVQKLDASGLQYTDEDVIKVANAMIDLDAQEQEKTAEEELAQIRTNAFYQEVEKNAGVMSYLKNVGSNAKAVARRVGDATADARLAVTDPVWRKRYMEIMGQKAREAPGKVHEAIGDLGSRVADPMAARFGNVDKSQLAKKVFHGMANNPKKTGYGLIGAGTAGAIGTGYGLKKALD